MGNIREWLFTPRPHFASLAELTAPPIRIKLRGNPGNAADGLFFGKTGKVMRVPHQRFNSIPMIVKRGDQGFGLGMQSIP